MAIVKVTDKNWEDVCVVTHLPVLIELWAPTFPYSKKVLPIMEELDKEYEGVIKVCRCDIIHNMNVRQMFEEFRVDALPAVLLLTGGVIDKRIVGKIPKKQEIIDQFELERHRKIAEESWLKKRN